MKKYVLTGGPGIGKTTVIEILASMGYKVIPEAARMVIEEEQIKNSEILPWKNLSKFQEIVAMRQLQAEEKIQSNVGQSVFLDRGIIDGYGYCLRGGVTPPTSITDNAKNRYEKIFVLDPLELYEKDNVRFEDKEEAQKSHLNIIEAYKNFGYEPIFVPVMPPEDRVEFILNRL